MPTRSPKIYIPSLWHGSNRGSNTTPKALPLLYQWTIPTALFVGGILLGWLGYTLLSWVAWIGMVGQCVFWTRVWAWTYFLYPENLRGDRMVNNGKWDEILPVAADTSKIFTVKDKALAVFEKQKIPMFVFIEAYRHGKIDLKIDLKDALECHEDWALCCMTWEYFHFLVFCYIPETFFHNRGQDHEQVTEHYNTGNDFFNRFLGPRMVYTSGYYKDGTESLEVAQDQKMALVAQKIGLKPGMRLLDLGCGWGTWVRWVARENDVKASGLSISAEQLAYAKELTAKNPKEQANIEWLLRDYRDMPQQPKWDRITCFEMAEHVGIRRFREFLRMVYNALDDDGVFYLQIAGLRECWQYEDVNWGLFMDRYIFRGADASLPINWVTSQCESENFEVAHIETIGAHYSKTIEAWYKNWLSNQSLVLKDAGQEAFRTYEIFLAWSTRIARIGGSTCFQIVLHKNLNKFDRFALSQARQPPKSKSE